MGDEEVIELVAGPRVAICFCGLLSSFKVSSFQDPHSQEPNTYSQVKKLVDALPADVFCSVIDSPPEVADAHGLVSLLSPKRVQIRPEMPHMKEMVELGKDPNIDVMQACYPVCDQDKAGGQARANGFVFWGINHAHGLMVEQEKVREKKYDIVLRMRYDLTFEEFFWTEAGAKTHFAYGMKDPPPVGSKVTSQQLAIFQNIDHPCLKVHEMVKYRHLTVTDTVEQVKQIVQAALDALDSGSSAEIVTTPAIHTWGGCNDQFGIGTRGAMQAYAEAWDRYHSLIEKKEVHGVTPGFFETLQTEKCLETQLRHENIGIIRSHGVVARILRLNGDVSTQ